MGRYPQVSLNNAAAPRNAKRDHGEVVKIGGAHYQGLPQSEALVSLDCVPDVLEECLTQKMPGVHQK